MTAKTPKTSTALLPLYIASDAPGGFLPSEELDRANAFGSKRLTLEAVLAAPRDKVTQEVRLASTDWDGVFASHASDLRQAADIADAAGHVRTLETHILDKISLFKWGESCAVTLAPKHPDALQLRAAELARASKAESDKYRVRYKNY